MDDKQLVYYPKTELLTQDPPTVTPANQPRLQRINIQFLRYLMRRSLYRSMSFEVDLLSSACDPCDTISRIPSSVRDPYDTLSRLACISQFWSDPGITDLQPYEMPTFTYMPIVDWSWGFDRSSLGRYIPSFDEPYRPAVNRVTKIPMVTITIPEALSIPNDLLLPAPEPSRPTHRPMPSWTIYENWENVHAGSVSSSVSQSISNLLTDPEPDFDLIIGWIAESDLSSETKKLLIQFCDDDSDTYLIADPFTFSQLFAYVWQRIHSFSDGTEEVIHDTKAELVRILGERVNDCVGEYGREVCLTGKISRLVSTLDGFFEDIRIGISDNDQITAIILQTRDSIKPYDVAAHVSVATQSLLDAGFEQTQFAAWIDALED